MTKASDRAASPSEREPKTTPQQSDESHELDTEIVRDLELADHADDIRGGCVRTLAGGCGYSGGGQVK